MKNEFSMNVESLIKEWLEISLSRPKTIQELENKWRGTLSVNSDDHRYGFFVYVLKPRFLRLSYEIETRRREAADLESETVLAKNHFANSRRTSDAISGLLDDIISQNLLRERKCTEEIRSSNDSHNPSQVKFQFPPSNESVLAKKDQRLLCTIAANSSSLVELTSRYSEAEMARTRRLDILLEDAERKTDEKKRLMEEINDLSTKLLNIREEADGRLNNDFHFLLDLAQTVENLKTELNRERNEKKRSGKNQTQQISLENRQVVVPIRESTIQLQAEVNALAEELKAREKYFQTELERASKELAALKSHKVKTKSTFQQSLRSLFKDIEVLRERLDRTESTLEKMNGHYDIHEDQIIDIVSPIIETIDSVRERVDRLMFEADRALYGEKENEVN